MIPEEDFALILEELERRPLHVNRYRKQTGEGRSQAFGIVGKRCMPPDYSRLCWKRAYLYKLLLDFADKHVDIPFNAITLNQNYLAGAHRDKNNIGESYVVAFGSYTGGELEVLEGSQKGVYDICRQPFVGDLSSNLHQVKPFQGTRMSIVYYLYPVYEEIEFPSVRLEGDKYIFYKGDLRVDPKKGLPHPLSGYKHAPSNSETDQADSSSE